jgi:hypothetical protein
MKWQDYLALASLVMFLLIFPITNALFAGWIFSGITAARDLVDIGLTKLSVYGITLLASPVTVLVAYAVWRIRKMSQVKLPSKTAKTQKAGKYIET